MNGISLLHFVVVLFSLLQVSCGGTRKVAEKEEHHPIEIPRITTTRHSCVIEYKGYTVSFNEATKTPDWVAYELTEEESDGPWSRQGLRFFADPNCPSKQADNEDYRHSGYSRGHLAPAGDMKWDSLAMIECFYFTNCIPQDESLNNGRWNQLEMKTRAVSRDFGRVYVVCGPVYQSQDTLFIGANHVAVPDACFKALLIPRGESYSAIVFLMHNAYESRSLKECAMTVDALEAMIGMDLYYGLPDELEELIEGKVDWNVWELK